MAEAIIIVHSRNMLRMENAIIIASSNCKKTKIMGSFIKKMKNSQ